MQVVHSVCCGLDVHKRTVVACLLSVAQGKSTKQLRTFGTTTGELRQLAAWLSEHGCRQAAIESTGVYWKPVFNILESSGIEVLLVNAQHVRNVPGRKTDLKDAEWIAELLQHGLLRASFIPPAEIREFWLSGQLDENDWVGVARGRLQDLFGTDLLRPLEDSDVALHLNVDWNAKELVKMFVRGDPHDQLEKVTPV